MTADELRAAIAADCPHRLDDYDRHLPETYREVRNASGTVIGCRALAQPV